MVSKKNSSKNAQSKKKNAGKTKQNNAWLFLLVLLTLVISIVLLIPTLEKRKETEELRELQNAYMESVAAESSWAEELEQMRADDELSDEEIIEIAREKFGLVFPDEIQFVPEE